MKAAVPLSFSLLRSNGGTKKSNRTYRERATARGLRLSVLVLGDELSTKVSLSLSRNRIVSLRTSFTSRSDELIFLVILLGCCERKVMISRGSA
ncbi:hypothetical protein QQF64_024471 [Cirrhinus molitorella]|uniref:Uncharacterized protein n=1 Tax=Cirrhinus molitorella TaxID=172907 RepID=A0ABR3NLC5_9TELE